MKTFYSLDYEGSLERAASLCVTKRNLWRLLSWDTCIFTKLRASSATLNIHCSPCSEFLTASDDYIVVEQTEIEPKHIRMILNNTPAAMLPRVLKEAALVIILNKLPVRIYNRYNAIQGQLCEAIISATNAKRPNKKQKAAREAVFALIERRTK